MSLTALVRILKEVFSTTSTAISATSTISATSLVVACVGVGLANSSKGGHSITMGWPKVEGQWEVEGWGPWLDFYDPAGNKEHNSENWIAKGRTMETTERLSSHNLVSFNMKQSGLAGSCLNSIVLGFNKNVPVLGGTTLVLDAAVMKNIFVDPHMAWDKGGIACIWWGNFDRGADYLNFNAEDLNANTVPI